MCILRASLQDGVHVMKKDNVIPDDVVRVMKTQDMAYVHMKHAIDAKARFCCVVAHGLTFVLLRRKWSA